MNNTVVRVEGLGKQYRIGAAQAPYRTLRETLVDTFAGPFRSLNAAIRRQGHTAAARTIWALRDVSFEIGRGEVVGIVGRNGAGKSTLLKILSRITEPTEGYVRLRGRVGTLLEVGTGFHPELTGRENIYLNGAILGMRRAEIERKFDEIVAFAEVEQFIDTAVKHYSSGMYLRLAFAVAAHLEPEILIVDEVLAVGDAAFQKKCLGKMSEVASEGRTVLFVSHNMGAVRGLCRQAIWLHDGQVRMVGPVLEVVDGYIQTTLDPASMRISLDDRPRVGAFSHRLRLRKIEFNGGRPILHGQPLTVAIEYETYADVEHISFGFGFATLDGVRLMTIDSDLQGVRRTIPGGTRGIAEAYVDTVLLQPGHYVLDVGARSGDNNALDYLPGCAQIDVLPGPDTPNVIIRDTGGVRMPALWEWHGSDKVGDDEA
jgi:lipopolysaccharide transport system ATP-binding protein